MQVITKLLYLLNQGETFTKVIIWCLFLFLIRSSHMHMEAQAHDSTLLAHMQLTTFLLVVTDTKQLNDDNLSRVRASWLQRLFCLAYRNHGTHNIHLLRLICQSNCTRSIQKILVWFHLFFVLLAIYSSWFIPRLMACYIATCIRLSAFLWLIG